MAASTDVEQASVVHIAVSRDEGKYEVAVFPQRVNDITLFFTPPEKKSEQCAEKPREVVWIAHGLVKGQSILIKAKIKKSPLLPRTEYMLTASKPIVHSGPARQPAHAHGDPWPYSVTLFDKTNPKIAVVDPDVIIKNDP